MRAGVALSAVSHAALIALALWALPWLRVRPGPRVPAVSVTLVSVADLAAMLRAPAPPETPAPDFAPMPQPAAPAPALPPEATLPLAEPDPDQDLAPDFDPDAPFGFGINATGAAVALVAPAPPSLEERLAEPPRPRPDGAEAEAPAAAEPAFPTADVAPEPPAATAPIRPQAAPRASFEAEVRAAVARAKAYPKAARERGIEGAARIEVSLARDGRLLQARLLRSSGDAQLDAAGLDAARRARLPAAPADLPGASFRIEVGVSFEDTAG